MVIAMSTCKCYLDNSYPRISGRVGQIVDLDVTFNSPKGPKDPFWIKRVEIYRCQISSGNLVAVIPFSTLEDEYYPAPACMEQIDNIGNCGTSGEINYIPGRYHLPFLVPDDFEAPQVYIDKWYFYSSDPCSDGRYPSECVPDVTSGDITSGDCDYTSDELESSIKTACHKFWVYPELWTTDGGLQSVNFAFESLNVRFHSPEVRPLEVALIPLPVYSYNKNLVHQLMPFLSPTITIGTQHHEILVDNMCADVGTKHGSSNTNPWVVRYMMNTKQFLKGTYWYQITLNLPDGTTRVSPKLWFEIR